MRFAPGVLANFNFPLLVPETMVPVKGGYRGRCRLCREILKCLTIGVVRLMVSLGYPELSGP